jgi:hypothetical protein
MRHLATLLFASAIVFSFQPTWCQEEEKPLSPQQQLEQLDFEMEKGKIEAQIEMQQLEVKKHALEVEKQQLEIDIHRHRMKHRCGGGALFLLMCVVVNILLTFWVYKDTKKRDNGQGIWIPIVLLTGLLGVIPYAIIRLADEKPKDEKSK